MENKYLQNNFVSAMNALLLVTIVYFLLFRCFNLTPDLIYRHSWGESQYAMWASSCIKDGCLFGVTEVDYFKAYVNYLPVASYLAAVASVIFDTDLVFTGRVISFLFSIFSVVYFNKLAVIVFKDDFKALVSTVIFVVLPINMYFSRMLYNDPLHLFFIIYLTYLLFARRSSIDTRFYYGNVFIFSMAILITKPTTALIYGLPMLYLYFDDWKKGRFDKKEFICIASAFFIVAIFILVSRMVYPSAQTVESNKMIVLVAFSDVGVYLMKAWKQLSFQFQHYYYVYILALPLAVFSAARIRFFFFMSLGFIAFYLLFIKGALIHQYYSLPFVLPFSIIAAYGMFRYTELVIKNKVLFPLAMMVLLFVFAPTKENLYYNFKPIYSKDVMYLVEKIKKIKGRKDIFVSDRAHKVFQYYLNISNDNVVPEWDSSRSVSAYLDNKNINIFVISNDKTAPVILKDLDHTDFQLMYCSKDYLVYQRNIKGAGVEGCQVKTN